ncbi:hypothetical protein BGX27_009326 [Mortierella sp. AM989]|nr:hypothetical protein BGX27_009326 [Mortierella sp. AM989]
MLPSEQTTEPKLVYGSSLDYHERRKRLRLLPPSPSSELNPFHAPTVNALEGMFERVMAIASASNKPLSSTSSSKWHLNSRHQPSVDRSKPRERDTIASWPANPLTAPSTTNLASIHADHKQPQSRSIWPTLSEPVSSTNAGVSNTYRYMIPPSDILPMVETAQKPQERQHVSEHSPHQLASNTRTLKRGRSPAPADGRDGSDEGVVELLSSDDGNVFEEIDAEDGEEILDEEEDSEEFTGDEEYGEYEDEHDQHEEYALDEYGGAHKSTSSTGYGNYEYNEPQAAQSHHQPVEIVALDDNGEEQGGQISNQNYEEADEDELAAGNEGDQEDILRRQRNEQNRLWGRNMGLAHVFDTGRQRAFAYGSSEPEYEHPQGGEFSADEDAEEVYSEDGEQYDEDREQSPTYDFSAEIESSGPMPEKPQINGENVPSQASPTPSSEGGSSPPQASTIPSSDDVVLLLDSDNESLVDRYEEDGVSDSSQDEIEVEGVEEEEKEGDEDEGVYNSQGEDAGEYDNAVELESNNFEFHPGDEAVTTEEQYDGDAIEEEDDAQDTTEHGTNSSSLVFSESVQNLQGDESGGGSDPGLIPAQINEEQRVGEGIVNLSNFSDVDADAIAVDDLGQIIDNIQQYGHSTTFKDFQQIPQAVGNFPGDSEMRALDQGYSSITYPLADVDMDVAASDEQHLADTIPLVAQFNDSGAVDMDLKPAPASLDSQVTPEYSDAEAKRGVSENERISQTLLESSNPVEFNPEHVSLLERLRAVAQEENITLIARDVSPNTALDGLPTILLNTAGVQPIPAPENTNTSQSISPVKILDQTSADNDGATDLSSSVPRRTRLARMGTMAQTVRDGKAFIEQVEARTSPNSKNSRWIEPSSSATDTIDEIPSSPTLSTTVSVAESAADSSSSVASNVRHRSGVRLLVEEARAFCSGIPGPSRTGSNSSAVSVVPVQAVSSPTHRPLIVDTSTQSPTKPQSIGGSPSRSVGYVRRRISFGDGNNPSPSAGAEHQTPASSNLSSLTTTSTTSHIGVVDLAAENVIQSTVVGNHALRPFINSPSPVGSSGTSQAGSQVNAQEQIATSPGKPLQAQPVSPVFTFGQMPPGIGGSGSSLSNSNASVGFSFGMSFVTAPREASSGVSISPKKNPSSVVDSKTLAFTDPLTTQRLEDSETIESRIRPEQGGGLEAEDDGEDDDERDGEDEHDDEHNQVDSDNDNSSSQPTPSDDPQSKPIMVRAPKKKKTSSKTKKKNMKRREANKLKKQQSNNSSGDSNGKVILEAPSSSSS